MKTDTVKALTDLGRGESGLATPDSTYVTNSLVASRNEAVSRYLWYLTSIDRPSDISAKGGQSGREACIPAGGSGSFVVAESAEDDAK